MPETRADLIVTCPTRPRNNGRCDGCRGGQYPTCHTALPRMLTPATMSDPSGLATEAARGFTSRHPSGLAATTRVVGFNPPLAIRARAAGLHCGDAE